jgi:hypothetical protein
MQDPKERKYQPVSGLPIFGTLHYSAKRRVALSFGTETFYMTLRYFFK